MRNSVTPADSLYCVMNVETSFSRAASGFYEHRMYLFQSYFLRTSFVCSSLLRKKYNHINYREARTKVAGG